MRVKLDENERAAINARITAFEGCDDPGCWCHMVMPAKTDAEARLYIFDLQLKFEFDPQGLTEKQKGILAQGF